MTEIDARKLECPKPVLLVKEEADKGTAQIRACVDNEVAAGNVTRFFESRGYTASREDGAEGIYITGQKSGEAAAVQKNGEVSTAILFTSDKIGAPSDGLGEVLMKAYIGTLTKTSTPPSAPTSACAILRRTPTSPRPCAAPSVRRWTPTLKNGAKNTIWI